MKDANIIVIPVARRKRMNLKKSRRIVVFVDLFSFHRFWHATCIHSMRERAYCVHDYMPYVPMFTFVQSYK